jgi:hypothetical protein
MADAAAVGIGSAVIVFWPTQATKASENNMLRIILDCTTARFQFLALAINLRLTFN